MVNTLWAGENANIGNNMSILHHVTLWGTRKYRVDMDPKIEYGVMIGVGDIIFGNDRIGEGDKFGVGSVVLIEVPSCTTTLGDPAILVGGKHSLSMIKEIPNEIMYHTLFISVWYDYVI